MDMPPRQRFHIMCRPGAVGILMPTGTKAEEGFSLSSPAEVRMMLHNLGAAAHIAFPGEFPDLGPMQGRVSIVGGRPGGLEN